MPGFVVSSVLVIALVFALDFVEPDSLSQTVVETVLWFTLAIALNSFLNLVLWRGIVKRWTGADVPRVLTQLSAGLLFLVVTCIVLVRVFDMPVTSVVTTSSVFIAIVGFALRNMISDLFTGIALGIEQPFSLGDWIQIQDGTVGKVEEMNWRSTRLITREEISVVIPNSELALSTFKNYSKPERAWRDEFDILLDQSVTAHQAERILLSAVRQIPEIAAVNKPPEVRISEYTENGIIWQVRYWVPDYPEMSSLRYEVQKSVLRNMHYAGLTIPASQIRLAPDKDVTLDGDFLFLRGIDLFKELSDEELRQVQYSLSEKLIEQNAQIVNQGEPGESLFIVKEGLLKVDILLDNDQSISVAHLVPGSFFGEMSLLTGDPRNATVSAQVDSLVYEVSKKQFEPILKGRPEIALFLSETITARQSRNEHMKENSEETEESLEESLLERIRLFFSLNGEQPPVSTRN